MIPIKFIIAARTDIGIRKTINQDSLSVKKLKTSTGTMVFAILCDGLGGLSRGELASATVVKAFEEWVTDVLPHLCKGYLTDSIIKEQWESIMKVQNQNLYNYGYHSNTTLGTTATLLLLTDNKYYIMNIGDTRAYLIDEQLIQITQDHSFIEREIQNGNMTKEEAENDLRRNVLWQCIGASKEIYPDMYIGETNPNTVFMLCTDGFRHKVTSAEIFQYLNPKNVYDSEEVKSNLEYLINLNKERQETDNISVIAIRTCRDE